MRKLHIYFSYKLKKKRFKQKYKLRKMTSSQIFPLKKKIYTLIFYSNVPIPKFLPMSIPMLMTMPIPLHLQLLIFICSYINNNSNNY